MKLYTHPLSTFARRVEIALLEKDLSVEREVIDMANRAHRKAPFTDLNPYGRVPVLTDGDLVLWESTAILEYLEGKHPDPALLPASLAERALVSMHMKLCDLQLGAPSYSTVFARRFLPKERWDEAAQERGRKEVEKHLGILNAQLEGKAFLVAERFTLADLCYIPFLDFLPLLEIEAPSNVARWAASLAERPSAIATKSPM